MYLTVNMHALAEEILSVSLRDYSGLGSLKAEPETGLGCLVVLLEGDARKQELGIWGGVR